MTYRQSKKPGNEMEKDAKDSSFKSRRAQKKNSFFVFSLNSFSLCSGSFIGFPMDACDKLRQFEDFST